MARGFYDGRYGGKSKLIILLTTIILIVAGYFVFKSNSGFIYKVIGVILILSGIIGFFSGKAH